VQTNRGRTYYYHPPTKKTSWTPPDEVKKAMEQLEEEEERAAHAEPEPPQPVPPAPVAPPAAPALASVPDLKRKPEMGAEGEREDADSKRPRPADAPAGPPEDPAETARYVGQRLSLGFEWRANELTICVWTWRCRSDRTKSRVGTPGR